MKRILVPTDFSAAAARAVDYAAQLAQKLNAELVLFHAWQIPYNASETGSLINMSEVQEKNVNEALNQHMDRVEELYPNVKCTAFSQASFAISAIKNMCTEKKIDLVVMGTTGASGIAGKLIGSNTSRVMGKINVPLLAVPNESDFQLPESVIVATDLTRSGWDDVFLPLRELAVLLKLNIEFINILKEGSKEVRHQDIIAAQFDEIFDYSYHVIHFEENPDVEEGILDYIERKDFDMLCIVAHHRGFWERMVHKSVSKSLVKHAKIPVLVLPG